MTKGAAVVLALSIVASGSVLVVVAWLERHDPIRSDVADGPASPAVSPAASTPPHAAVPPAGVLSALTRPVPGAGAAATFNRDIAPIFFNHCAACHRPGESGPFNLLTYDDARKHARQVVKVTQSRFMPPWLPEAGYGHFAGERRLGDGQVAVLRQWAEGGMAEGEAADLPAPPRWTPGWQLGPPDAVVRMPEAFTLPAGGRDVYRNFVMPASALSPALPSAGPAAGSPAAAARWVRAAEMRPGNPKVVHHAFLMIDRTPESRRLDARDAEPGYPGMDAGEGAHEPDGEFHAWNPGKTAPTVREGVAWRLEPGTDLVLQTHLRPSGAPEELRAAVGLYFTDAPPTRFPFKIRLNSLRIDIPAGAADYVVEDSFALPVDVEAVAVKPHAHYLCREMRGFATLPDGTRRWLIWIKHWDFDWQDEYACARPVPLPAGTVLAMHYVYDNSAANPANPNSPPRRVVYGPNSADEMGELALEVVPRNPADLPALRRAFERKRMNAIVARFEAELGGAPRDARAHFGMAKALFVLGRTDEALAHFRSAVEFDPSDVQARDYLGRALLNRGDLAPAAAEFERAARLDPSYFQARTNLGLVYLRARDFAGAASQFQAALRINPDDSVARANFGVALLNQGDAPRAAAEFEAALRLDPDNAFARENLARAKGLRKGP